MKRWSGAWLAEKFGILDHPIVLPTYSTTRSQNVNKTLSTYEMIARRDNRF
jgi:hypothetical protein